MTKKKTVLHNVVYIPTEIKVEKLGRDEKRSKMNMDSVDERRKLQCGQHRLVEKWGWSMSTKKSSVVNVGGTFQD